MTRMFLFMQKGEESVFRFVDAKLDRIDLPIEKYLEILRQKKMKYLM